MPKSKTNSPAPGEGHVTIRNIAKAAGVSIGSVSSVLNNRHIERRISPETVQKVKEASARLGYLPNLGARRLRSMSASKNHLVLALVTSFEAPIPLINHFIIALRNAIAEEKQTRKPGSFSMMIEMYSAGRLKDLPGVLTGDHFNAAIIMNTIAEDDQFLTQSHLPYPVVLVNRALRGYASVVEDASSGARSAEIFFKGRRKNLAVLYGNPLTQTTQVRMSGFVRRAAELTGRPAIPVVADELSEMSAYKAMKQALGRKTEIDALYTVSDALAMGAYRAIKEAKRSIPDDISVIGTGDYEISALFDPPLSTVGVPHSDLAKNASRLLMAQLRGAQSSGEMIVLPVANTFRDSAKGA